MSNSSGLQLAQLEGRPAAVTLIAVFQFAKAGFFLFVAAQLFSQPLAGAFSGLNLSRMITVVSADGSAMMPTAVEVMHGRTPPGVSATALAIILALTGGWLIYVGWGLWLMKGWARRTRIGISILQALAAMTVLTVYLPGLEVTSGGVPLSSEQWRDLFLHMVVNLAMIFYLMWDVNVVDRFKQRELVRTTRLALVGKQGERS